MAVVEDQLELCGKLQVLAEKYGELATTLIRRFRRHALDMQPGEIRPRRAVGQSPNQRRTSKARPMMVSHGPGLPICGIRRRRRA